ncbi:MAG: hypothetical protein WC002_02680 [Candidatus Muiribacteriota bacterium]
MNKRIIIGNIFDIGGEFKEGIEEKISVLGQIIQEPLRDLYSNYFIKLRLYPFKIKLDTFKIDVESGSYQAELYVKIFPYGAVILFLSIESESEDFNTNFDLFWIKNFKINNEEINLTNYFKNKFSSIFNTLEEYIEIEYSVSEFIDEYRILIDNSELDDENIFSLLINDKKVGKCSRIIQDILNPNLGCFDSEKVIITSKNAYVKFNEKEIDNIQALIELGYTQMYELKVYDYLLDEYIETLYKESETYKFNSSLLGPTIFSKKYKKLIERAMSLLELRVDIVDLIRDISNALKVTDDVYYSHVYSKIIEKLKFSSLYETVKLKIEEIEKFNSLMRDEDNVVRAAKLEFWIILLFVVDIIIVIGEMYPGIYSSMINIFKNLFN